MRRSMLRPALVSATLLAASLVAACSTKEQAPAGGESATASSSATPAAPAAGGEQTPDAGGQIIKVEMLTDDEGNNIFRPADFEAKPGDVIRYTLVSGVHNVHFLADSNPGKTGLPPAGDMLQVNGQTWDVKVSFAPGTYYYHCDPHALLGMKGHLTVK